MLTILRCSLSEAAFKEASLIRVSDFVSSNRKGAPQVSVHLRDFSGATDIFLSMLPQIDLTRLQRRRQARRATLGLLLLVVV